MRYQAPPKIVVKRFIAITVLAAAIYLLMWLAAYPRLVERYYSEGFYVWACRILHPVFNIFPFSVGDLLYISVIFYLVYALVKIIRLVLKKEFKRVLFFLSGLIAGIEAAVLIFYLFWGMNYFRPSASERLNMRDTSFTTHKLIEVTARIIDSANVARSRITEADKHLNNTAIYQIGIDAVKKLSADSADFRTYRPGIKSSLLTPLLNYLNTSGYYNPFTTEAQLNYQMPYFERPVVVCHELSHQIGFGAEDEADFVGFLAGVSAKNRLLRYSAYHMAEAELMGALYNRDSLANKVLKKRISTAQKNDFKAERLYWLAFRSKAGILSGILYGDFLKANNQPHGLDTYNQMVLLVMAWYAAGRADLAQ